MPGPPSLQRHADAAQAPLRRYRRISTKTSADGATRFGVRTRSGLPPVAAYRSTILIGGDPGVLELLPGADDHLLLRAHLPHWKELIHVVDRARRVASLDLDLDAATAKLADDAIVGQLLRTRPGVRPPRTWDAFETGVHAIIGQQGPLATTTATTGRPVERLGSPVLGLHQLGLSRTFPTPSTLAEGDLSRLGLSRATKTALRRATPTSSG